LLSSYRAALAAAVLGVLLAGCAASIAPQIHTDADRVPVARRLYEKGDYTLVIDVLNAYTQTGTGNADIDQAVHLLGLAYLHQREWTSAQSQFERIQRDYPESDSATAAAYRLGEALFGQSRSSDFDQEFTLKAMTQWEGLVQSSPDEPYAPIARARIAECRVRLARKLWRNGDLYVKLKLYEPARQYFQDILDAYPDTPVYGDAVIGRAVAEARLGRRDSALAVLRGLEQEFHGRPLGARAAEVRAKMEKWPATGDMSRRRHKANEAPPAAPQNPSSASTPYAP
jgi:outer membrane assembly lipoprotein YfiO